MITYNEIYSILRQEKYNETLQKLPAKFLEELKTYIEEKSKIFEKDEKEFDEALKKLKRQFENAKSLIDELFSIRQKKILNLALLAKISGVAKSDLDNMLKEEKELFYAVLDKLRETEKKMKERSIEKDLKNTSLVRFKSDIEEFLDGNGKTLGPFKKDDIANLPKEIAEILINDGKAVKIE
ncbi:MAG: hypothetical protein QW244_00480 [Candidatus Pacearchaeota archaeon]